MQGGCLDRFIQYHSELPMNFSHPQNWTLFLLGCCAAVISSMNGCDHPVGKKEKKLRSEVHKALTDQSYNKAADLAQHLLTLNPQDNGSWDRLVQAQFGLRDHAAVKKSLEQLRNTVKKSSPKLDEYAGDLAFEERDLDGAIQAWTKVLGAEP